MTLDLTHNVTQFEFNLQKPDRQASDRLVVDKANSLLSHRIPLKCQYKLSTIHIEHVTTIRFSDLPFQNALFYIASVILRLYSKVQIVTAITDMGVLVTNAVIKSFVVTSVILMTFVAIAVVALDIAVTFVIVLGNLPCPATTEGNALTSQHCGEK